jgi:hypothetical protein
MPDSFHILSGQVVDPAGKAVALASVYFVGGPVALPDIALLTGADGSFTLAVPVEGRYEIGIRADHYQAQTATFVAGGQENALRIVLRP